MSTSDPNTDDSSSNLMFLLGQLASINKNPQSDNPITEPNAPQSLVPKSDGKEDDDDDYNPEDRFNNTSLQKEQKKIVATSKPVVSVLKISDSLSSTDPQKIISYSKALKYIVQILIPSNPNFIDVVRALIEEQQRAEVRWYKERQAIIKRQASRSQGRQKLNTILGRLSSISARDNDNDTARDNMLELRRYDIQVYRNAVELMNRTKSALKTLRVPLICVDRMYAMEQKVDLNQLEVDTQKVLDFLQDLCEDENTKYLDKLETD